MKISKRQLRRIVREEKRRILEGCGDAPPIEPGGVGLEPAPVEEPAPLPLSENEAPLGDLMVEMEVAARALEQVVEAVQNAAHLCPDCGDQVAAQAPLMEAMVHQAEALAENLEAQVAVIAESAAEFPFWGEGVSAEEAIDFTGDVAELPGDEAFGLGYIAGSQGLE